MRTRTVHSTRVCDHPAPTSGQATPPMVTVPPSAKFKPVMVMGYAPEVAPLVGERAVSEGAVYVNCAAVAADTCNTRKGDGKKMILRMAYFKKWNYRNKNKCRRGVRKKKKRKRRVYLRSDGDGEGLVD